MNMKKVTLVVLAALVAFVPSASAQELAWPDIVASAVIIDIDPPPMITTVTGKIVDAAGKPFVTGDVYVYLRRLKADGSRATDDTYCANWNACVGPDGSFSMTIDGGIGVSAYKIGADVYSYDSAGYYMPLAYRGVDFSLKAGGSKNLGKVKLFNKAFQGFVQLGQIPASGGPVAISINLEQLRKLAADEHNLTFRVRIGHEGETVSYVTQEMPEAQTLWPDRLVKQTTFPWPQGFQVPEELAAGSLFCPSLTIEVTGEPERLLGEIVGNCVFKQPALRLR